MGSGIDRYHDGEYGTYSSRTTPKHIVTSVYEGIDMAGGEEEYVKTKEGVTVEGVKERYEELNKKGVFDHIHDNYDATINTSSEEVLPKQERYLNLDGKLDYIDECAVAYTPEEFRGAMKFTIGKYQSRLGKKDNIVQEVTKIADYANRWLQYEVELESKEN